MTSFAATAAATPPIHINGVYITLGAGVLLLLALLWRATRRPHIHVHAPAPAPEQAPRPRRRRGGAVLLALAAAVSIVGFAMSAGHTPVTAAAKPTTTPARAPSTPAPKIITHIIQTHPTFSGSEVLILAVIAAVVILGLASLLGHRRRTA